MMRSLLLLTFSIGAFGLYLYSEVCNFLSCGMGTLLNLTVAHVFSVNVKVMCFHLFLIYIRQLVEGAILLWM